MLIHDNGLSLTRIVFIDGSHGARAPNPQETTMTDPDHRTCTGDDDCTECTLDAALNCRFEKKRLIGFIAMVIPFATRAPGKATSSDATPTTAYPRYGDTTPDH